MILSEKQRVFLGTDSKIDVVEGASGTGKTQILKIKFILKVNQSERKQHFISGQSAPVVLRNLVDDDLGILNLFKNVKVGTDAKKGNHLIMTDTKGRVKIIYIFGYGDSSKWMKVLGSTTGCGLIDEVNLAPYNFIVQCFRGLTRPDDNFWLGLSLNPTEPNSEIYSRLINKARPIVKYLPTIPTSIIEELKKTKSVKDYLYWHFNHGDNPILTQEAIQSLKDALLPDSPEYLSLVEGLRCSATGAIFAKYLNDSFMFDGIIEYDSLDIGIDIGSGGETGAKSIMTLTGFKRIENKNHVYNEDEEECLSDNSGSLIDEWANKIKQWYSLWGLRINGVFIDNAGTAETMRRSLQDKIESMGIPLTVNPAWKFGEDGGIQSRLFVMYALINQKRIHFRNGMKLYSMLRRLIRGTKKGVLIEDNNDEWNDYYDAWCYSWTHRTEDIR